MFNHKVKISLAPCVVAYRRAKTIALQALGEHTLAVGRNDAVLGVTLARHEAEGAQVELSGVEPPTS